MTLFSWKILEEDVFFHTCMKFLILSLLFLKWFSWSFVSDRILFIVMLSMGDLWFGTLGVGPLFLIVQVQLPIMIYEKFHLFSWFQSTFGKMVNSEFVLSLWIGWSYFHFSHKEGTLKIRVLFSPNIE